MGSCAGLEANEVTLSDRILFKMTVVTRLSVSKRALL